MKVYHRLAAGAALGAIAVTAAAPADAKARKHAAAHKRAAVTKHKADPRDAEIQALEAKVDALTQRLDATESSQQRVGSPTPRSAGRPISTSAISTRLRPTLTA
jgi:membrane protein involved in colicin uptake